MSKTQKKEKAPTKAFKISRKTVQISKLLKELKTLDANQKVEADLDKINNMVEDRKAVIDKMFELLKGKNYTFFLINKYIFQGHTLRLADLERDIRGISKDFKETQKKMKELDKVSETITPERQAVVNEFVRNNNPKVVAPLYLRVINKALFWVADKLEILAIFLNRKKNK